MALDFRLLTEDRRTSEDTAALSVAWFQYYTSVHVRQSAICILHSDARVFTIYYTVGYFDDHAHHGTNTIVWIAQCHVCWGDQQMGNAISCKKSSQVPGLIH